MMVPRRNAARFRPPDAKSKIFARYEHSCTDAAADVASMFSRTAAKFRQSRRYFGHCCIA
jgi:hypothetical protein